MKISIIIPVYNNFNLTLNCINSIIKNSFGIDYEIIVSDDCSSDETKEFFTSQNEIIYRRNEKNRGFAYTCNRGAEIAKGEYLLFLNNDTLLIDNILPKFIKTFEDFPKVGIVGAKLLYEDNTIQHAGVVFNPMKSPCHIFNKFPGDYYSANKVRKLKCVTGACLFIQNQLFFEIGMFDENFVNGFEDLDLCLKVFFKGYDIIYNPEISLYHFERKTRGFSQVETKNSLLITERWFNKITMDTFLFDENYEYKLNDIGEFYIIKEKFENLPENEKIEDIINYIKKEPLFFAGYKKIINHFISNNNYLEAINYAKLLINFEPIIDNFYTLYNLYSRAGLEKLKNHTLSLIKKFEKEKLHFFKKVDILIKKLLEEYRLKECSYFIEWLHTHNFINKSNNDIITRFYNEWNNFCYN